MVSRRLVVLSALSLALATSSGLAGGAADGAAPPCAATSRISLEARAVPAPTGWFTSAHGVDRHGRIAGVAWPHQFWKGRVFTSSFASDRFTSWGVPPSTDDWKVTNDDFTVWSVGPRHVLGTYLAATPNASRISAAFHLDRRSGAGGTIRQLPLRTLVGFSRPWAVGNVSRGRASRVDVSTADLRPVDLLDPSLDPQTAQQPAEVFAMAGGVAIGRTAATEPFAVDVRTAPTPTVRPLTPLLDDDPDSLYTPMRTNGRYVVGFASTFDQHPVAPWWTYDLAASDPRMRPLTLAEGARLNGIKGHLAFGLTKAFDIGQPGFVVDLRSPDAPPRTLESGGTQMGEVVGIHRGVVLGLSVEQAFGDAKRFLGYDLRACTPRLVDLGPANRFPTIAVKAMRGAYVIGADPQLERGHYNAMVWRLGVDRS